MLPHTRYYESIHTGVHYLNQARIKSIGTLVGDASGQRLLDAGCGDGYMLEALYATGAEVIALDLSAIRCLRARTRHPHLPVLKADILTAPFRESCFDVVVAADLLEHLWDPEEGLRCLVSLLAPNGLLVVSIPNEPVEICCRALTGYRPVLKPDHRHLRLGPIFFRVFGRSPDYSRNIPRVPFPFCLHRVLSYRLRAVSVSDPRQRWIASR